MGETRIEWADKTWNPVTGCPGPGISPGCEKCYAKRRSKRMAGRFGYPKKDPFQIVIHDPKRWAQPASWKKPACIFTCSMGDLFHVNVPDRIYPGIFRVCRGCPQHTFLFLTKRPHRMVEVSRSWAAENGGEPLRNVWMGVTAENQRMANSRIPMLSQIRAEVKYVSCEPMLEKISLKEVVASSGLMNSSDLMSNLHWVIAGPETGSGARPISESVLHDLASQCYHLEIPFFLKKHADRSAVTMPDLQRYPNVT